MYVFFYVFDVSLIFLIFQCDSLFARPCSTVLDACSIFARPCSTVPDACSILLDRARPCSTPARSSLDRARPCSTCARSLLCVGFTFFCLFYMFIRFNTYLCYFIYFHVISYVWFKLKCWCIFRNVKVKILRLHWPEHDRCWPSRVGMGPGDAVGSARRHAIDYILYMMYYILDIIDYRL